MSKRDGKQSRAFRQFAMRFWPYCQWCGARLTNTTATTEHIVPLGRHGTNRIWNLALACQPCNNDRGADIADRPLLGPRWSWPHYKNRTCVFLIPLTRNPVMSLYERRRPLASNDRLHVAFPVQLPITVELPPLSPGLPAVKARYEPGDMMVFADTMPNGDPLVMLAKREAFEGDYRAVPYESEITAAHGGVESVTVSVTVKYKDGVTRTFVPLDVGEMSPDELRRRILDAGPDIAKEVSLG